MYLLYLVLEKVRLDSTLDFSFSFSCIDKNHMHASCDMVGASEYIVGKNVVFVVLCYYSIFYIVKCASSYI